MSNVIIYSPPSERRIWNPTLERIIGDVLGRDEKFWRAGTGCGSIFLSENLSVGPSLVMAYTGQLGFYVEMSQCNFVSIVKTSDDMDTVITLPIGQSISRYPAAYLVSREQCASIAGYFYVHGMANPDFTWIDKMTAPWTFYVELPEDDD